MMVSALVESSYLILSSLLIFTIIIWLLARIPIKKYKLLLFAIIFAILTSVGTQAIFYTESVSYFGPKTVIFYLLPFEVPIIGRLPVTMEGINYGFMISLRLIIMIVSSMLLPFTTHPSKIILMLRKARLPNWFVLMFTMSLRFIPLTFQNLNIIRKAQKLRRGKFRIRDLPQIFGTLLIISLKTAKQMALALESKAFGQSKQRTSLKTIKFATKDILFCLISIIFILVILYEVLTQPRGIIWI